MDNLTKLKGDNAGSEVIENMENIKEDPRITKFAVFNPVKTPGA